MCGALSYGQHRMDRGQDLVMAERRGDKGGDKAGAQSLLHEARLSAIHISTSLRYSLRLS